MKALNDFKCKGKKILPKKENYMRHLFNIMMNFRDLRTTFEIETYSH